MKLTEKEKKLLRAALNHYQWNFCINSKQERELDELYKKITKEEE